MKLYCEPSFGYNNITDTIPRRTSGQCIHKITTEASIANN